ncbi:MAG: PspA/IM30 family protein [Bacteroidetes bacterium]|nr:PspA/IM30 family protein [Bacteroidota bacterium]MDA0873454.1 PspA/IM30 family protein [Bacteroidota bacterium]
MSIWVRFKRLVKSIFGGAISALEDPKLILEQNIRELNDQVPKMNENIATVKANVMMLQKEVKKYEKELADVTSKIKAGIQAGRDDIAERYAMRMESVQESLASTKDQLKYASAAYDKALQVKKAFMREKERKIAEAKEALRAHERAQWQAKVADTLESFEVAGIDQTHDEMLTRLQEQTARNEARMEMALDSVDTEALKIEEDAQKIRASELVKQFKLEMGMGDTSGASKEEPQLDLSDPESETSGKTIGRERTQ